MTDAADGQGYRADVEHFSWPGADACGNRPRPHRRQRVKPTDSFVLDVAAVTGTVAGRVERHLLGEVGDTIERLTRAEITESGCNPWWNSSWGPGACAFASGLRGGGLVKRHRASPFLVDLRLIASTGAEGTFACIRRSI
jgi:hypothetical protein